MEAKTLGMIQIVLAILAVIFAFWNIVSFNLPVLLLALIFVIMGYHHITEKK